MPIRIEKEDFVVSQFDGNKVLIINKPIKPAIKPQEKSNVQTTMANFMKGVGPAKITDPKLLKIEKKVVSLKQIVPGLRDWIVKLTCLSKHPLKTWQNSNGKGFVLSVDFFDATDKPKKGQNPDGI